MDDEWKAAVESRRDAKDEYFRTNPHSPLPPPERDSFEGLAYYPVDEDYRFELPLDEYDEKETLTVGTSTGGETEYLRWGRFEFAVDGESTSLEAFRSDPDEERLWVPFRDATSGEATYGAGRYLDLEADEHRTDEGTWILDFNEAYNPTCAYSEHYECPLPPTENWLDVPIEAGEQTYEQ